MSADASPLDRESLPEDPLELLERWLADAAATGMTDPNAMTLATAGRDGRPSARTVLLRGIGPDGLRCFTNRLSLKGRQLAQNPRAQALFHWNELGRQILVHGPCTELSDAESDAYFATRRRESQLGAWASDQGTILPGREALEARLAEAQERFADRAVERPPHWGGYLLAFEVIEFWQAHPFRLHDRFVYVRTPDGWQIDRLAP
ncbi:MAG: pyridoxamine 5'-phosphate oxidase [Actinobacteria bacterium]|nr:pyridoxamine 5'-phosphate oxidase [Actinomycetota bacterium]